MRKTLATLTVVFAANTGLAHDEANCRDISNLLARLSCYDESHSGLAHSRPQRARTPEQVAMLTLCRQQTLLTRLLGSRDACSATAIRARSAPLSQKS